MTASYSVEAILRAVDKGFTATMKQAQDQISGFARYSNSIGDRLGKLSDGMVNVGESMTKYVTAPIVAGVGGVMKSYAELEQNISGTTAVFGEHANVIQNQAREAYINMGLSASDCMATANKMGSLFQGSGLTQRRALELTSQAMQRAADVASVMGVDTTYAMDSIANAAKGNFTMMDNLGVAMNATTLEAYALEKGINFDWNTASNAEKAELAMRMFMDRTSQYAGNFRKEVETTLSGSFGALASSFKNLRDGLGQADVDTKALFNNVYESAKIFAQNVKRVLGNIWKNIPLSDLQKKLALATVAAGPLMVALGKVGQVVAGAMKLSGQSVEVVRSGIQITAGTFGMFRQAGATAIGAVSSKFTALTGLVPRLPAGLGGVTSTFSASFGLMSNVLTTFASLAMQALLPAAIFGAFLVGLGLLQSQFGEQIGQMANVAITQGPTIITNLVNGIVSRIPELINQGTQLIQTFTQVIVANAPAIFQGAVALITALVQGVGNNAGQLIASAVQIISVLVNGLLTSLPQLLSVGMQFLVQLAQGVVQNIPLILQKGQEIILNFINSVSQNLPQIIQSGIQIIITLVQGLIQNLPQIIQTAVTIIQALVQGIASNAGQILIAGIQLIIQLAIALIQGLPTIIKAGIDLIVGLGKAMLSAIPEALSGVWEGIKNGFSSVWDWVTGKNSEGAETTKAKITETADTVTVKTQEMATNAGTNASQMKTSVEEIMASMQTNVTATATDTATGVNTQTQAMADNAIANATLLNTGVSEQLNSVNADGLQNTLALATGVGQNFATANADATANAQAINSNVTSQLNATQTAGQTAMAGFSSSVSTEMSKANQSAVTQANQMAQAITQNFNKIKSSATSITQTISSGFKSGMTKLVSTVTQSGQKMLNSFKTTFNGIKTATTSAMNNLKSQFRSGMNQVANLAQTTGNRVVSIFRNLAGRMQSAGHFAGMGFYNGLASSAGSIYALASQIASTVASTIRRGLQVRSPSRVMKAIGGFTGQGMALGMEQWIPKIEGVSKRMAESAVPDLKPIDLAANLKTNAGLVEQSLTSKLKLDYQKERQPLQLSFNLGQRSFGAFVEDIFEERAKSEQVRLRMRPI